MKKVIITVTIIALAINVNSQNDKLDKVFNKIEKGVDKGVNEARRISKELRKELKPVFAKIKEDAKPVVDRIWEEASKVYEKGEELVSNAADRLVEAKKSLAHDVKDGIVSVDEELRREERIEAVERALKNLNDSIKENKESKEKGRRSI
ncbi:MAG: hypothetical protein JKY42_04975 [Flavobacteriales bacterium]|nr:hypothetical protein [Flavobacteriales bacterium]